MPDSFQQRISSIEHKGRMLIQRYRLLEQQLADALERNEKLAAELDSSKKQIESLTTEVEFLKLASNVETSKEDITKTRRFFSELVWEIDKCITQLSE